MPLGIAAMAQGRASSAGLRSQKWSEGGKVATISPEFPGWVFWCEVLVVTFFRKQVNQFQRANVFYTEMCLFGKQTSVLSLPLDCGLVARYHW